MNYSLMWNTYILFILFVLVPPGMYPVKVHLWNHVMMKIENHFLELPCNWLEFNSIDRGCGCVCVLTWENGWFLFRKFLHCLVPHPLWWTLQSACSDISSRRIPFFLLHKMRILFQDQGVFKRIPEYARKMKNRLTASFPSSCQMQICHKHSIGGKVSGQISDNIFEMSGQPFSGMEWILSSGRIPAFLIILNSQSNVMPPDGNSFDICKMFSIIYYIFMIILWGIRNNWHNDYFLGKDVFHFNWVSLEYSCW